MESATTSGRAAMPCVTCTPARAGSSSRKSVLATPKRTRAQGKLQPTAAFGAAAGFGGGDFTSDYQMLSNLASATGFALGAFFVGREILMEQKRQDASESCSTCQGTGRVPCICQRWSDNDVGCGSCGNTGMAVCKDCRGGGTKVPVARTVPIYVEDDNKYRDPYNGRR